MKYFLLALALISSSAQALLITFQSSDGYGLPTDQFVGSFDVDTSTGEIWEDPLYGITFGGYADISNFHTTYAPLQGLTPISASFAFYATALRTDTLRNRLRVQIRR